MTQITITQAAIDKLAPRYRPGETMFKLYYDTEYCGCEGVYRIVPEPERELTGKEALAAKLPYRVYYETRQDFYFEDELKLDYNASNRSYVLKSDGQCYNFHLTL